MHGPWAALILVLFIFVSNSIAEDKNDETNSNKPTFREDTLNITETDDVTKLIDQIINKLNDNPVSRDREETFVLDSKVGNVKVENQQLGNGKYKIVINKKQAKNKPKKSIRTYKIKVKSKARVQPKKITFDTNTENGADINSIISKFIGEQEKSKIINADTSNNNLNVATGDNVQALNDSDQLREIIIKFIQNSQAHSGSKIVDNDNLNKFLSYLWTIIKSNANAPQTGNHEKSAVIALDNDEDYLKKVSQQSNGKVGSGVVHRQQTTFHLPIKTTNQLAQNPNKIDDKSFKIDDIQAFINLLNQENSNVNNFFTVGSLTPQDTPKPTEKYQFDPIKEQLKVRVVSKQENTNLDDSRVQGLVSKLCDAAKNNVIEFWNLLQRYLGSNAIGDKIENETNKKSPLYELIKEILKENNKDLKNHKKAEADWIERSLVEEIKKPEHKVNQFEYTTVGQTTTTDATIETYNTSILTPLENLARYGDLSTNNPTRDESVTHEINKSFTIPQYDIELITDRSVVQLRPESNNNTLKYQEEGPNPNLVHVNDKENNEQDETPITNEKNENNTLERKKPNWLLPAADNHVNLIDHTSDEEPHVNGIDNELHPSDHVDDNDKFLHPSFDVNENDNPQYPSDHVHENDNLPYPSDHFNKNVKETPLSNHIVGNYTEPFPPYNVIEHDELLYPSNHVIENDIGPPPFDHLNENVKETLPSNHLNGNYTKPVPPYYYVIEHDKPSHTSNHNNEKDIVPSQSDHLNGNVKETPANHVNGNYTETIPPYYVIEHDKLPYPSNQINENDIVTSASDHLKQKVIETPPSNHDNGNYTEPLPPYDVFKHNKLPHSSNHVNKNDKETPSPDLINENNKDPLLLKYFIEHTKLPHPSNHVNEHLVHENDSAEKESGVEETSEDKTQVKDHVALPESFDYEFDSISTESPEFSQELLIPAKESFVNSYPLNQKIILQYLDPQGKIKNDGLKDNDEYFKYINSLPAPVLQSFLLSLVKELNADADPTKPKVDPDIYLLLNKLLQLNVNPHINNYNKNVHSVVNKHTYPDFYIILNKLKDLGKKKNKISQGKIDENQVPDDETLSENIASLNKNKNSGETLNNLIAYLKSSLPDDPSDCRVKSYNDIMEKIINFFRL